MKPRSRSSITIGTQLYSRTRSSLRRSTLAALSGALGVTIDYLVSGRPARRPMLDHRAVLYESDAAFAAATVPFLSEAIDNSEAALAVTSARNIELLQREVG